jgi:hypothetical protein
MQTITEMNRTNAKLVRVILEDRLPSILKEHGLSFELGNARYDDDGVKFTGFKISVKGALSEAEKALRDELQTRDRMKFKMLDQSKIAELDGMDISLVGFKPRARKKPFIIQDLNSGNQYVIGEKLAERLFKSDAREE